MEKVGKFTNVPVAVPVDVNSTSETAVEPLPKAVVPLPERFTTILPGVNVVPADNWPSSAKMQTTTDWSNPGLSKDANRKWGVMEQWGEMG